eukprot:m.56766 g.56766  ORF g.56766 m.56766 type:complete len:552 (+) comp7701_c1_seq1:253-1908(+)
MRAEAAAFVPTAHTTLSHALPSNHNDAPQHAALLPDNTTTVTRRQAPHQDDDTRVTVPEAHAHPPADDPLQGETDRPAVLVTFHNDGRVHVRHDRWIGTGDEPCNEGHGTMQVRDAAMSSRSHKNHRHRGDRHTPPRHEQRTDDGSMRAEATRHHVSGGTLSQHAHPTALSVGPSRAPMRTGQSQRDTHAPAGARRIESHHRHGEGGTRQTHAAEGTSTRYNGPGDQRLHGSRQGGGRGKPDRHVTSSNRSSRDHRPRAMPHSGGRHDRNDHDDGPHRTARGGGRRGRGRGASRGGVLTLSTSRAHRERDMTRDDGGGGTRRQHGQQPGRPPTRHDDDGALMSTHSQQRVPPPQRRGRDNGTSSPRGDRLHHRQHHDVATARSGPTESESESLVTMHEALVSMGFTHAQATAASQRFSVHDMNAAADWLLEGGGGRDNPSGADSGSDDGAGHGESVADGLPVDDGRVGARRVGHQGPTRQHSHGSTSSRSTPRTESAPRAEPCDTPRQPDTAAPAGTGTFNSVTGPRGSDYARAANTLDRVLGGIVPARRS